MFFRILQHLLPTGAAWRLYGYVGRKSLADFFSGLMKAIGSPVRSELDKPFLDVLPQSTTRLDEWERQFGLSPNGLTEQERRDRLEVVWAEEGGQGPDYIQQQFQARGFDVYVHDWWEPGTNPPVARNPNDYVSDSDTGYILVNKVYRKSALNVIVTCGNDPALCGNDVALANNFSGFTFILRKYDPPSDPAKYPYVVYIGGQTFPNLAQVPTERKAEFEKLALRLFPTNVWVGVLVEYV